MMFHFGIMHDLMDIVKDEYIIACSSYIKELSIHKLLERLFDINIDAIDIYCENHNYTEASVS